MIVMIKKKISQKVCWFNWKNCDWNSSFLFFCIWNNMIIFYHLIYIDVHIKITYIEFSHIKLLRQYLKYRFLLAYL